MVNNSYNVAGGNKQGICAVDFGLLKQKKHLIMNLGLLTEACVNDLNKLEHKEQWLLEKPLILTFFKAKPAL